MNYADIKKIDVANGEGVRVSLFVSGVITIAKDVLINAHGILIMVINSQKKRNKK